MKSETEQPQARPARSSVQDRKFLVLIALLILIAVTLYSQWNTGGMRNNSVHASAARSSKRRLPPIVDPTFLFSKLQEQRQEFSSEQRNLFNFHAAPPPAPPPQQQMQAETESEPAAAVCGDQVCQDEETYENCPTDCQAPPPPDITLKYIGYLAEDGGPVVFLTDGKEVYMGRENDIIANKYRILKITDQSVELGYLNLNQSRSIPFQGNNQS